MRVYVYYNLHRKVFSVRALEGPKKGLVVAHREALTLENVVFKVSEAGRQRVLREQKKNVHAGVVGQWQDHVDPEIVAGAQTAVTYNPYKYSSFVRAQDEKPIKEAGHAFLTQRKIYV